MLNYADMYEMKQNKMKGKKKNYESAFVNDCEVRASE
jgi:hypothetical protein